MIVCSSEYKKDDLTPVRPAPLPPPLAGTAVASATGDLTKISETSQQPDTNASTLTHAHSSSSSVVTRQSPTDRNVNNRMSVYDILDKSKENDFSDDEDW